jgi:hypothetical protein
VFLLLLFALISSVSLRISYDFTNIQTTKVTEVLKQNVLLSSILKDHRVLVPQNLYQYKSCCISHSDSTPSMSVSDEKGLFHCFSCGESGDVISMIKLLYNCTFIDAVRRGIEVIQNRDSRIKKKMDYAWEVAFSSSRQGKLSIADAVSQGTVAAVHELITALEGRKREDYLIDFVRKCYNPAVGLNEISTCAKICSVTAALNGEQNSPKELVHDDVSQRGNSHRGVFYVAKTTNDNTHFVSDKEKDEWTVEQRRKAYMLLHCASLYFSNRLIHVGKLFFVSFVKFSFKVLYLIFKGSSRSTCQAVSEISGHQSSNRSQIQYW